MDLLPDSLRCSSRRPSAGRAVLLALIGAGFFAPWFSSVSHGGDILRGGAAAPSAKKNAAARANAGAVVAAQTHKTAQDRLARTTQAIQAVRNMQSSARAAAIAGANNLGRNPNNPLEMLPDVPNGLGLNGLDLIAITSGANAPQQNGSTVQIRQTDQQATLEWRTFNVGKNTTVYFDQRAGGTDAGKWIAFNKVSDPAQRPSQILGAIKAEGQVYVINKNGIIFGGSSQVNTRTLVASSLPINDNLVASGLLNNRDAQFLFSGLDVPGGSDGTPAFLPAPLAPGEVYGNVEVRRGARLISTAGADGNGGRIMLVGANVNNQGTISTPGGQTILAAGLQVGIQSHNQNDPSLRGLDVWVGDVGDYAGTVTNSGSVESPTGNIMMVGKEINQNGTLESSTSVSLNGRIDLLASYGAVGHPNFDSTAGSNQPPFLNQFTGVVRLGQGSVIRIMPEFGSNKKIPGTNLSQQSQVNMEGAGVYFGPGSILLAPSGKVNVRAGSWGFQDTDGNRTTLNLQGSNQAGLNQQFVGGAQRFVLGGTGAQGVGQVYVDSGALIDVSGSTTAFVAARQHIVTVQMRGSELADSPLIRDSMLRGINLIVDLRRSGTYGGREWVGTPLGDLTGLAGIIERDVAQLTATGGSITLKAGDSVVVNKGATLDVSGGFVTNEGGFIRTSRLRRGNQLINIEDALPNVTYDSIYEGKHNEYSTKWGVNKRFAHALAPMGGYYQQQYVEGAAGGTIQLGAPSLVLAGELLGRTVKGPRQLDMPPLPGSLRIALSGERQLFTGPTAFSFIDHSPTPPSVQFVEGFATTGPVPEFTLVGDLPVALPTGLRGQLNLGTWLYDEEGGGFGNIEIDNKDGDFLVQRGTPVTTPPEGSLVVLARNISLQDHVFSPGGTLSFTAYNFSPYLYQLLGATGALAGVPAPAVVPGRGIIEVGSGVLISAAGMIVDDRPTSEKLNLNGRIVAGGSVLFEGYSVLLGADSVVDVSGGVWAKPSGKFTYGDGGNISILSGKDPELSTSVGGELRMDGWLQAYSAEKGGSLTIQSNLIQIGGSSAPSGVLHLQPEFFRRGGFTSYSLIGLGGRDANDAFLPGVRVVAGTIIEPLAESWAHIPHANLPSAMERIMDYLSGHYGGDEASSFQKSLLRSIRSHGTGDLAHTIAMGGGTGYGFRAVGRDLLIPFTKPLGLREPASLYLSATGYDDPFTENRIEAMGIVQMEADAKILTDPGATVGLSGDFVSVLGEIIAPGGNISIEGRSSFRLPPELSNVASFALPTVFIGSNAKLSTAGTVIDLPDLFGRRSGIIYPGGTISISGNIVTSSGAVLDVSGTSAVLDFHPTRLGGILSPMVPKNSGLTSMPWGLKSVPVRVDSDGGLIELTGAQFLYSDATLLGSAGGDSALGGTLSVSSGRFYASGESRTGADINLIVEQSGSASVFGNVPLLTGLIPNLIGGSNPEAALTAAFSAGNTNRGTGYFSVNQFSQGGFDSLDLGFQYFPNANPIPYGGNIEFRGPVRIDARGFVRLAGGGVIQSTAPVSVNAAYVAIGQEFRPPLNPNDPFIPFRQFLAGSGTTPQYFFPPTSGTGSLSVNARVIDIGTLSLLGMGRASFAADGGDIRGNGILSVAGDILLRSAQIYPTTLATFDIFAFDPAGSTGSVTIQRSGFSATPLSAGGALRVFASTINQGGVLRAPFGSISLGWDGTDTDLSTAALDVPFNPVVGTTATVPTTQVLQLLSGSITSVSAIDDRTGKGLLIPFGISPDGLTWIDPRGVDITVSGLPARGVSLSANSIETEAGSVVDVRGGGDLLGYRWVPGTGGSVDLLGEPLSQWSSGSDYSAGDLVLFGGRTWSARVDLDPEDFASVPRPSQSRFWTEVPDAYAVVPGFSSGFAPFNSFNTGTNSGSLQGDPGYISSSLRFGEQIYLEAGSGLPAGNYTLLPRRYALLPGAYLVIPVGGELVGSATARSTLSPALKSSSSPIGGAVREEGSFYVSGYTFNSLRSVNAGSRLFSRFEVVPPAVLAERAEYEVFSATALIQDAASRLDLQETQRLPIDSAPLKIHGNDSLFLQGRVLARSLSGGRGADIDISSFSDIYIIGGSGVAPPGSTAVLDSGVLSSWNGGSLLIGGQRRSTPDGTVVDVRSNNLTLNNPGGIFSGGDITLVSSRFLSLEAGSSLSGSGGGRGSSRDFRISGDGTLLRVSGNPNATVIRSGVSGSTLPLLTIGAGSSLTGGSVFIDSTYGSDVDPTTQVEADTLTLGSGQISVLLSPQAGPLAGQVVDPHLILEGEFLAQAQSSRRLSLLSYRTIDIYGDGDLGTTELERLEFLGGGLRGFGAVTGGAHLLASEILFANTREVAPLPAPASQAGALNVTAEIVRFGANDFRVDGYENVAILANGGAIAEVDGSFETDGNLSITAPILTGSRGSRYSVVSSGDLNLLDGGGPALVSGGLGASMSFEGASVFASANILLPSGLLSLRATTGDITVAGGLSVEGSALEFYDITRYADAGRIDLIAQAGNVSLLAGSSVSVAANPDGGNAGTVSVRSPLGLFDFAGTLSGAASPEGTAGTFLMDASSVGSLNDLSAGLDAAGFLEERNLRIRTGDVTLGGATHVRKFALAADGGSITINGLVDASGETGGRIEISARDNLTLAGGSILTVAADRFNNAGKGGHIFLEAGAAINGVANTGALLDIQANSEIDLSVSNLVAGNHLTAGSSAFYGQFEGTLHLRAPRLGSDVRVGAINGEVIGGSSILVEAFRVYEPASGEAYRALRDSMHADNVAFMNAGEAAMRTKLLGLSNLALDPILVVAPGVEIINSTGDLQIGKANPTGSTDADSLHTGDWDLSGFRYGTRNAPGILTLRAQGNILINNTLSDGFNPIATGAVANFRDIGHSQMWLASLQEINPLLPVNSQSWSYRISAGADLAGASFRSVLPSEVLNVLQPNGGSLLVGEFYPQVPSSISSGTHAAVGSLGQTADTIRISTNDTNRGTRFEVIRTGTGEIDISVGRDVQLRNSFATIYTAGVGFADRTTIFQTGDFAVPITVRSAAQHPSQGTLGAQQQNYEAYYAMAGGNLRVNAQGDIGRFTFFNGEIIPDASGQLPTNWLYRRGLVDPFTGLFAVGGVIASGFGTVTDPSASTTWWVDYSNFFQGFGALGGGNVDLIAGNDLVNADAAIPTNARMAGRDGVGGVNLAPDPARLLEHGGGDLVVKAGRNVDGGNFYVERGTGQIFAGGEITTNSAQSPSRGILSPSSGAISGTTQIYDPLTWQAVTLYGGRSSFDVAARGNVLLGPMTSAFLLPQGINNKFWYKTQFQTISEDAGVDVVSFGGGVTHRLAMTIPGETIAIPTLEAAYLQTPSISNLAKGYYRPWLRLAESNLSNFRIMSTVGLPSLRSTAMGGDVSVVGTLNLFPSPSGSVELLASGGVVGMNASGQTTTIVNGVATPVTAWTSARINLSDTNPATMAGVASPLGFQQIVNSRAQAALFGPEDPFGGQSRRFQETGSFTGVNATSDVKSSLHAQVPVHMGNPNPIRLYAAGGDISSLTLFSPKKVQIFADRDITDIAFYLQHLSGDDISIVSAGRDVVPYNENAPLRSFAGNIASRNFIVDQAQNTVQTDAIGNPISKKVLSGDIQIGGRGTLEVLAGRNIDLGTGANFTDGTGVGITSIGRARNPFLPFEGADLILLAGVQGPQGGAAVGLAGSSLSFDGITGVGTDQEQQAIEALAELFALIRSVGDEAAITGDYSAAYAAIGDIFGSASSSGEIITRARDVRTSSGGSITIAAPAGGLTMASDIFGNPLTPPGIVTEYGGAVSIFTQGDVEIGQARIFTLRGGDLTIWSSSGDIAAGNAPKTVVTAPPTRILIDSTSADIVTDLGGLATGGGIGVLASVEGVEPGGVFLIAPEGTVDAGDAGIRATGNISIAAAAVVNADNIAAGGASTGVPAGATVAAPSIGGLTAASTTAGAASSTANQVARENTAPTESAEESPSIISVEVLGYGGGGLDEEEEDRLEEASGSPPDFPAGEPAA